MQQVRGVEIQQMSYRKAVFYWCSKDCLWDVNFWSGGQYGSWWIVGSECELDDDYFDEIDERPVVRQEAE